MINDKSICEKCDYEELNNEAIKLMYCNKCDNYSDKEIKKEIELLKELKLTNKVLVEEVLLHVKEKHKLIEAMIEIKEIYDADFTTNELEQLFSESRRDELIYEIVMDNLKEFI